MVRGVWAARRRFLSQRAGETLGDDGVAAGVHPSGETRSQPRQPRHFPPATALISPSDNAEPPLTPAGPCHGDDDDDSPATFVFDPQQPSEARPSISSSGTRRTPITKITLTLRFRCSGRTLRASQSRAQSTLLHSRYCTAGDRIPRSPSGKQPPAGPCTNNRLPKATTAPTA
jgi:hypothetical protein